MIGREPQLHSSGTASMTDQEEATSTTPSDVNNSTTKQKSPPSSSAKHQPTKVTPILCTDPPLECSQSDYDALLSDASNLANVIEASVELLDCARYGEVDACRAILDIWIPRYIDGYNNEKSSIVDVAKDASRSTPLHKACSNGHASVVRLLLARGFTGHAANDSGNTPLHWAAAAGKTECVGLVLDHHDALVYSSSSSSSDKIFGNDGGRLDVLKRNAFGRSALTEGFASGDTKTIERLLNHDSAEEERLIGGLSGKEVKTDEDDVDEKNVDGGDMDKKNASDNIGIVHEFDFLKDVNSSVRVQQDEDEIVQNNKQQQQQQQQQQQRASVLIRELPIAHANDPFGQSPIEDTTGLGIWCASLVMSRWMASPDMVARMSNTTVLELGAGCGTPSLCAAIYGTPKSVTITDLNPVTINNAQYNIELNRLNNESCGGCSVTATSIDWGDETTYPTSSHGGKFDYVICSDCIYQRDIVDLLKKVVTGLLHPEHGAFLYVAPESGRDGLDEFIETMKSDSNFECVSEVIAPDSYRTNPLKNGDEEDCFLHFHELASKGYILYEFRQPAK